MRKLAGVAALVTALAAARPSAAIDYCVDPITGSDAASGRCADRAWATLTPALSFPFVAGDRVLLAAGRHVHPQTAWYMTPGVSWIGAGRDRTTVAYDKTVQVPFVRFTTGSAGSGRPTDLRPEPFTPATLFADMTLVNEGQASIGIEVATTSGDSAPTLARLRLQGFPTGVRFHPASDERLAASTHVVLTNSIITTASSTALSSLADVFYNKVVTEASSVTNTVAAGGTCGARIATLLQDLRDAGLAAATPILTNDTIVGGTDSAALLVSYYDDGTGAVRTSSPAGSLAATLSNSIFTGSSRHGIEESSASTEPAVVASNDLGGNARGDYLDEGATILTAAAVGTGNVGGAPLFVDAAAGDFHVMATSPSVDRIPPASAPSDDVDGHPRPQAASSDMGADELVPCAPRADASATRQAPPCTGGTSTLDASRSFMDPACVAGPSFEWLDGAGLVGTGATLDVTPASSTTYRLRVRCADPALSACVDEDQVTVEPSTAPPVVDAGSDGATCAVAGEMVTLRLAGTAAAVPPATLVSTTWSATDGTIASPSSLATTLSVVAPSDRAVVTVTLTAVDSMGCSTTDAVVLAINARPVPVIAPVAAQCHAEGAMQVDVPLSVTTTGGSGTLLHAWSASSGTIVGAASARLTVAASAATQSVDVSVTTTDERGCVGSDAITIVVGPSPVARAGADESSCRPAGPASIPLDASSSTGEAPLAFEWTTTRGVVRDPSAAVTTLDVTVGAAVETATVTLVVTSGSGTCSSTDAGELRYGPGPTAAAGGDLDSCEPPGIVSLPLDASGSSGSDPLAYLWRTTAGRVVDAGAPLTSLELDVGTATEVAIVTLEVTDADGACVASDELSVVVRPEPSADAGGPYASLAAPGPTTSLPLDATGSSGEGVLAFAWTTTLGTFADTGTTASALARPTLDVVNQPFVQRGRACLVVGSDNGCDSPQTCTNVVVLLEPVSPPNDVSPTLRVTKAPPDDVALTWQDAPVDAAHDEALAYETWAASRACGPFTWLAEAGRVAGTNESFDPVLRTPSRLRHYVIVSVNDGGASVPSPPDGASCP